MTTLPGVVGKEAVEKSAAIINGLLGCLRAGENSPCVRNMASPRRGTALGNQSTRAEKPNIVIKPRCWRRVVSSPSSSRETRRGGCIDRRRPWAWLLVEMGVRRRRNGAGLQMKMASRNGRAASAPIRPRHWRRQSALAWRRENRLALCGIIVLLGEC